MPPSSCRNAAGLQAQPGVNAIGVRLDPFACDFCRITALAADLIGKAAHVVGAQFEPFEELGDGLDMLGLERVGDGRDMLGLERLGDGRDMLGRDDGVLLRIEGLVDRELEERFGVWRIVP